MQIFYFNHKPRQQNLLRKITKPQAAIEMAVNEEVENKCISFNK